MKVYVIDCSFLINNGSPNTFVLGAWKKRPTHKEAEEYIRQTTPGCVKIKPTGELWPGIINILEYDLRSTTRMSIAKNRK